MKTEVFEVQEEQENERLDKFLSIIYPDISRSFFQKLIKDADVLVNDKAEKASYRMCFEDVVTIHFPDAATTIAESTVEVLGEKFRESGGKSPMTE